MYSRSASWDLYRDIRVQTCWQTSCQRLRQSETSPNKPKSTARKLRLLRVLGRWGYWIKAHSLPKVRLQLVIPSLLKLNCCGGCSWQGILEPMLDCGNLADITSLCNWTFTGAATFHPASCASCHVLLLERQPRKEKIGTPPKPLTGTETTLDKAGRSRDPAPTSRRAPL